MTDAREERFAAERGVTVDTRLASGEIVVAAGEPGEVRVRIEGADAERFTVRHDGQTLWIRPGEERRARWRRHRVTVRVPDGAGLVARTASADVSASCALADVEVESASGDVRLGTVDGDCRATSASGDVRVGRVAGELSCRSASGEVSADEVGGGARLQSASGDVRLGTVRGDLTAKAASGDILIDEFAGQDAEVRTTSGDVRVGVPSGRSFDLDVGTLSGSLRSDFTVESGTASSGRPATAGDERLDGRVWVRSVSGDVHLRRASR